MVKLLSAGPMSIVAPLPLAALFVLLPAAQLHVAEPAELLPAELLRVVAPAEPRLAVVPLAEPPHAVPLHVEVVLADSAQLQYRPQPRLSPVEPLLLLEHVPVALQRAAELLVALRLVVLELPPGRRLQLAVFVLLDQVQVVVVPQQPDYERQHAVVTPLVAALAALQLADEQLAAALVVPLPVELLPVVVLVAPQLAVEQLVELQSAVLEAVFLQQPVAASSAVLEAVPQPVAASPVVLEAELRRQPVAASQLR